MENINWKYNKVISQLKELRDNIEIAPKLSKEAIIDEINFILGEEEE